MPRSRCRILVSLVVLLSFAIPAEARVARREPNPRPVPANQPAEAPAAEERPLARNLEALQQSLDQLARMDTAQWELLEILITLDDDGWRMLKQVLSMPQADLDRLVQTIEAKGGMAGSVVNRSDPQSPTTPTVPGTGNGGPVTPDAALSLTYIYNQIVARVDSARSGISGVRGRIDTLLPDNADVRGFFSNIPLSSVTKLLDTVKEGFGDVIDNLDTLREGYDSFNDAQMKQDLMGFLDDLETLARLPQELNCFDDSGATVRDLNTDLIRKLINVLPKVVLLAMDKMLGTFASDWRTALKDVIDRVPMDLREGICEPAQQLLGEQEGSILVRDRSATRAALAEASSTVCRVLRKTEILGKLRIVRLTLKRIGAGFDSVAEFLKDDQTLNLTIVALGGGGAGTNVKLPAKPLFKTIKNVADLLSGGSTI